MSRSSSKSKYTDRLGCKDSEDRQQFIQLCISLGIAYPKSETEFHGARVFNDTTNSHVYCLIQWTDTRWVRKPTDHVQTKLALLGTTPPPLNALHFAGVDNNLIMARPTPAGKRKGYPQTKHTHSKELCQFYRGKDVTLLSSQRTSDLINATVSRCHGQTEKLMCGDLMRTMRDSFTINVSETVLSSDDHMCVERYGGKYGDIYKDRIAPYESAYKAAIKAADKENFSSSKQVKEQVSHRDRVNEAYLLKEAFVLKLLNKATGFTKSRDIEQQYLRDEQQRPKSTLRTKGQTVAGYLKQQSIHTDTAICITDDRADCLDSILEQCTGRNLYLYLTDTSSEPATIVRYGIINSKENLAGPIGEPICITDFNKLHEIHQIQAEAIQYKLQDQNHRDRNKLTRLQNKLNSITGIAYEHTDNADVVLMQAEAATQQVRTKVATRKVSAATALRQRLVDYIEQRNQKGQYLTHAFGKDWGFSKGVKIGAAQALIDLLDGKPSVLAGVSNEEDQEKQDLYINALSQNRLTKRSELCKVISHTPGLHENIRRIKNPEEMVRAIIQHTVAVNRATPVVARPSAHKLRFFSQAPQREHSFSSPRVTTTRKLPPSQKGPKVTAPEIRQQAILVGA